MHRIGMSALVLAVALGVTTPAKADFRMEWYGVSLAGSNYGIGLVNDLFGMEWEWFYLIPLRLTGGGAGPGFDGGDANSAWYAKGGIMFGLPIHIGEQGQHVIRLGAGLSGGFLHNQFWGTFYGYPDTYVNESYGPFVDVEVMYKYRFGDHLALTAGFQGTVVVRYEQNNDFSVNGPNHIYAGVVGLVF